MNSRNAEGPGTEISSDLYLVRIWKRRSGDGAPALHGKLQHVVSGASCYFDGLSGLPTALEEMIEQDAGAPSPETGKQTDNGPDDERAAQR